MVLVQGRALAEQACGCCACENRNLMYSLFALDDKFEDNEWENDFFVEILASNVSL